MLTETQVLIAANGDIALAAETLQVDENVLLAKIAAEDAEGVRTILKVANALHTLNALSEVKVAVLSRLDEMSPATLAKLFIELIQKSQEISTETMQAIDKSTNLQVNVGASPVQTLAERLDSLIRTNSHEDIIDV